MARSFANRRRTSHGHQAAADDHDESMSTDIIRRRLSGSGSKKTVKEAEDTAKKSISFYHAMVICALAYYVGYLHGKVERYHADLSSDDYDITMEQPTYTKNAIKVNDEDEILSSVTTLRCLTTPGCYPRVPCSKKKRLPSKIPVLRHWEEHSFCTHDILLENKASSSKCLVYSFGLYDSIEWEAKMASSKAFGCEVFAFDPTSKFNSTPAPGVHFYKLGLKGVHGGSDFPSKNDQYGAIDSSSLYTLGELMDLLSHKNRNIDVLRLDCEGCEHGVLNQLACENNGSYLHNINQLMVEFHWQKSLGMANDKDLIMSAEAIQCLEKERWGLVSLENSGIDPARAQYIDSALRGVIKDQYFALYATFRRIPPNEMLPWQVHKDAMDASWKKELVYAKYRPRYGEDIYRAWPDIGLAEWNKTERIFKNKVMAYNALYGRDLTFDTFQKFEGNWEKWK